MAQQHEIRVYEELNDHLPPAWRKRPFRYTCAPGATIAGILAGLGIPLARVDLVLVDGVAVAPDHRPANGTRISVYPVFESLDITPLARIHPRPLRRLRFVTDATVPTLAVWMARHGLQVLAGERLTVGELLSRVREGNRILLTTDPTLLETTGVERGHVIQAREPGEQLREVLTRFDLGEGVGPDPSPLESAATSPGGLAGSDGDHPFPEGSWDPGALTRDWLAQPRRVLLWGEPGAGKSTLAASLARTLQEQGRAVSRLCADPGSPPFGAPGTVSRCDGWGCLSGEIADREALCTLDAARFRLPLTAAVGRLARRSPPGTLLVDAPGVVRGVAGAELLAALVEAAEIDLVLALAYPGAPPPLPGALTALGIRVVAVHRHPLASRPGNTTRARRRTDSWEKTLSGAEEVWLPWENLPRVGTPPPPEAPPAAWLGRQIALLDGTGATLALGEILVKEEKGVYARVTPWRGEVAALLVRDAGRNPAGLLVTRHTAPPAPAPPGPTPTGPGDSPHHRPTVHLGSATATLLNGIFDDPLLHLQLPFQKRSLLFDLGDAVRLPNRMIHQVSDVFISHAHFDHIGGFLPLFRGRIGVEAPLRLYGPPGVARHIAHQVQGILWDRIGEVGPRVIVGEFRGDRLASFLVQAGGATGEFLGERETPGGVILDEAEFRVRAALVDHGTPCVAYAWEPVRQLNVRKERLQQRGWPAGRWIGELKNALQAGLGATLIPLPDGTRERADRLGEELILVTPGRGLVYATDLADTPRNRETVIALAQGAHVLFCEAPFLEEDRDRARATGHLTVAACAAIAAAARVRLLVPFHFSRRYEKSPERIPAALLPLLPPRVRLCSPDPPETPGWSAEPR